MITSESEFEFEEIVVESANVRLSLCWQGEGREGDYDSACAEDYPHLRLDVVHKTLSDAMWPGELKAESTCTLLNGRSDRGKLMWIARGMVQMFEDVHDASWKRLMDHLSWTVEQDAPVAGGE